VQQSAFVVQLNEPETAQHTPFSHPPEQHWSPDVHASLGSRHASARHVPSKHTSPVFGQQSASVVQASWSSLQSHTPERQERPEQHCASRSQA
jgi:hypothetical protein